jgi:hypothetical protein
MRNGNVALSGHARVKRGETTIVPREQPLRGVGCNDTASRKAPRNGKNEALMLWARAKGGHMKRMLQCVDALRSISGALLRAGSSLPSLIN